MSETIIDVDVCLTCAFVVTAQSRAAADAAMLDHIRAAHQLGIEAGDGLVVVELPSDGAGA